jgi:hypothetical protein
MEDNAHALQTIIGEFKNLSSEITKSFIFNRDGEILARGEATTEVESRKLITVFNSLVEYTQIIGGLETLTIQGADRQLNVIATNNLYLTTVSSRAVDEKIVRSLTRVIVPTIIELMDHTGSKMTHTHLQDADKLEAEPIPEIALPNEEAPFEESVSEASVSLLPERTAEIALSNEEASTEELIPEEPMPFTSEPLLPTPPVNQFMVEKIGGLLAPSDTVRVDGEVLAKWNDLYGDKRITEVHIETLEGKTTSCKFKPIKESEHNTKGIIQIPEKIQQILQTSKGKLVIVKPVIA